LVRALWRSIPKRTAAIAPEESGRTWVFPGAGAKPQAVAKVRAAAGSSASMVDQVSFVTNQIGTHSADGSLGSNMELSRKIAL
jgi:hypothetical protein